MGNFLGAETDSYLIFKTIHIIGVVLLVGNIAVTAWWKTMADLTRDPKIIAFAQRQVTLTDYVFTAGGILLLVIGGAGSFKVGGLPPETPWIHSATLLFVITGIIWGAVLIPLQRKLARLSRGFAAGGPIPETYWRLERWWAVFGGLAILLPLATIAVMVGKVG